jgi:hypothetical protein
MMLFDTEDTIITFEYSFFLLQDRNSFDRLEFEYCHNTLAFG